MRNFYLLFGSLLSTSLSAQHLSGTTKATSEQPDWIQLLYSADPDPAEVISTYESYYATHPFTRNTHTQYFKRWLRSLGREIVPADPTAKVKYTQNARDYLQRSNSARSAQAANWSCIGPFDWDHDAASKSYACGAAHVYTVEQAASNTQIVYAGTANAGVWRSTDKGLNWSHLTQTMMVGSVRSLCIDHSNADVCYFGGDDQLYKTTNGGTSWATVGDAAFQAADHDIRDLVMHPTNILQLFVCSDQGLFRSDDGGSNFTQVMTGIWQELEFHPTNNSVVYATRRVGNTTEFWRSTNTGVSFTQMLTGWPIPAAGDEQERTEIAVTPAAPNNVYALCTGVANGGSGLYGVYVSIDQGASWTFQCCGPQPGGVPSATNMNLMGWSDQGLDDGGQYYYDLAFAVDPANANNMSVCGVQRWVSTDGGASFTCPAKWSHSNKPDYVHADIHDMRYYGNEIWLANDGGIFYSNDAGATFERRMFGIAGTDFWGFGTGGWTGADVMLGGTYHNGTLLKDNNVYLNGWVSTDGGDNYRGFVHPQYDRRVLSDYGYKTLSGDRTIDDGNSSWSKEPNATYTTGLSSEVEWHPNLVDAAYVGNDSTLWLTKDNGNSFTAVHHFNDDLTNIEVAFSDPDHLYVCTYPGWWDTKKIYHSDDAGSTWTDITPTSAELDGDTWVPYDIAVDAEDPLKIWITRTSMYGNSPNMDGHLVYESTDGGVNWTNISDATLNGERPTNIIHQRGTNGGLYIGTRRGIYHRNASSGWSLWNAGLPARIHSTKLQINYREGKIRNGTDQSVWESALEEPSAPIANFSVDRRHVSCLATDVQFWDNSVLNGNGTTWSWSFPGGTPATSSIRNPIVSYASPGSYDVTLTVTDVNGTDTRTITAFIDHPNANIGTPMLADAEDQVVTPAGWSLENPDDASSWTNQALAVGADGNPTQAWRMDYYYYNAVGQEDRLVTPPITLAGSAGTRLKFHHAYKSYGPTYLDGLRVDISTDCGQNWTQLYFEEGANLGTSTNGSNVWSPTIAADWELHDIDLSAYDGQKVVLRFVGINGYGDRLYLDNIALENNGVRLTLKMMLEGPYENSTQLMKDDMRTAALLPGTEPYSAAGFTHASDGGGETAQSGVFDITGDNALVDWVLVELRDATTPTTVVATRSALLQRDGDVVAEDGVSPIALLVASGNYHVAVKHRNHLGCMTANAFTLSDAATSVDLTNGSTAVYGTDALKSMGGKHLLWMGNVLIDGKLQYTGLGNDRDPILVRIGGSIPTNTVSGYYVEDITLDGVVKYTGSSNDRDPILVNVGGSVPTNIRDEQLP